MRTFVGTLVCFSVATLAQAASIVNDFSIASNPNGDWSYGSTATLGSSFLPFNLSADYGNFITWTMPGSLPIVFKNTSGFDFTHPAGTLTVAVGWLGMHPGISGEYAVVRYTVPSTGWYTVSGAFEGLDFQGPTSTDAHVLLNSTSNLFSASINLYLNPNVFSITQVFSAGDTIDFAVGYLNNNHYFDTTGLQGTVIPAADIPEPSTLVLMVSAFLGIAGFRTSPSKA
jgi:hypothetical protein